MISIRFAKPSEAEELTNLAIASEGYWGYDSDFMDQFKIVYKVTEDFISKNPTFIISENELIIGFCAISIGAEVNSLEYFYIHPENFGKGYGKAMRKY